MHIPICAITRPLTFFSRFESTHFQVVVAVPSKYSSHLPLDPVGRESRTPGKGSDAYRVREIVRGAASVWNYLRRHSGHLSVQSRRVHEVEGIPVDIRIASPVEGVRLEETPPFRRVGARA